MNIIDVDDAIISFGSIHAVNGVSLQVESGRTFALLGTNGAGKTTLLEACEGLRPISAGRLRVFGEDPFRNRRKIVSRLGIVLQQAAFPQSLLCREVITMWQRLASRPRQVDELIEVLNLESVAGMPMGKLSGGEKRRVDIACALIGSPELLFLDEPTTGLDPESRKAVWALINELQNAGTTIVLTTHYLEEVEAIADDLAILHRGQLRELGPLGDVVDRYPSSITFARPKNGILPSFPEATAELIEGDRVRLLTHELNRDTEKLMDWARQEGLDFTLGFEARKASLESIFFDIAGKPREANSQ